MGITRARKRLFLSCARSRALYNARNFAEPSRFLAGNSGARDRAQREIRGQDAALSPAAGQPLFGGVFRPARRLGQRFFRRRAIFLLWVQENPFASQLWRGDSGCAAGLCLAHSGGTEGLCPLGGAQDRCFGFEAGDTVLHRVFKRGVVVEVLGAGDSQRVRVRFDSGAEKLFFANAAPIAKVKE